MFLQAGDKVKALKCLIRSGDTDKIIFFAGVSRHAEIYTLAANYLQTLDWHARPDLAQSIVTFYSKVSSCTLCVVKHAAAGRAMVNANKGWAGSVSQASACRSPDRSSKLKRGWGFVQMHVQRPHQSSTWNASLARKHKSAWDMANSALFSGLSVRVCVLCSG